MKRAHLSTVQYCTDALVLPLLWRQAKKVRTTHNSALTTMNMNACFDATSTLAFNGATVIGMFGESDLYNPHSERSERSA